MKPVACFRLNCLIKISLFRILTLATAALLPAAFQPGAAQAQEVRPVGPIGIATLLPEMADLAHLAEFPQPYYKTAQASSYDRASTSPGNPGWFANKDFGNYLRVETHGKRQEQVMMEAEGPGAIVRLWAANPAGVLRVYLDGAEQPALEAPMDKLLSGKVPPFDLPLGHLVSRGYNLYFPIPYAKHCKVTAELEKPESLYYHVMYRTYPAGTPVETYTRARVDELNGDIQQTIGQINRPAWRTSPETRRFEAQLKPSSAPNTLAAQGGLTGGLVRELHLTPSRTDPASLRQTLLEISFDGQAPSVVAPLGDFFGSGPGLNAYVSLPFSVYPEGLLVCRWPMPFKKDVRVRVIADPQTAGAVTTGTAPLSVACSLTIEPYKFNDRSLYFHARWRADHKLVPHGPRDWNFTTLTGGRGVYVGNLLNVANPFTSWWGEGDEKVTTDGEPFPSIFGTGSEDYFGYAWCNNKPFQHPYHAQTRVDGPANYGHTSVNRWHVFDAIPFRESLKFDIEQMTSATAQNGAVLDAVSYWYAAPGVRDNFAPLRPAGLSLPVVPRLTMRVIPGAIEGEKLRAESASGQVEAQPMEAYITPTQWWSSNNQLWWHGAQTGERLTIYFDAPSAERYRVRLYLTKSPDYGIFQLYLNGQKIGRQPVDLWNAEPAPTGPIDLGFQELKALDNELTAQVIGANPKAQPGNMFGLDCLTLEPEFQ